MIDKKESFPAPNIRQRKTQRSPKLPDAAGDVVERQNSSDDHTNVEEARGGAGGRVSSGTDVNRGGGSSSSPPAAAPTEGRRDGGVKDRKSPPAENPTKKAIITPELRALLSREKDSAGKMDMNMNK